MGHEPQPGYRVARQIAGLVLVGVIAFVLIWDALAPDYHVDGVVVTSVLGAAAALLGVDILFDALGRRR